MARRRLSREEARRARRPEDLSSCLRLVEITHRLDDDPLRSDLREALINDDQERITLLARSDLSSQPPSTILLLGTALQLADQTEEALPALGFLAPSGRLRPPLAVYQALPSRPGEGRVPEAKQHLQAALALRPDSQILGWYLFAETFQAASLAEVRGRDLLARERFRSACEQIEGQGGMVQGDSARALLGYAYLGAGDSETGLDHLRRLAEDLSGSDERISMGDKVRYVAAPLLRTGELERVERLLERLLEVNGFDRSTFLDLSFAHVLRRVRDVGTEHVVDELRAAVESRGDDAAGSSNDLAWRAVCWPREALRAACAPAGAADPGRIERNLDALLAEALRMSETATAALDSPNEWSTLAWARFRLGDLEGCRLALEESTREGGVSSDFFLRALLSHDVGDEEEAARWQARAEVRAALGAATRPR